MERLLTSLRALILAAAVADPPQAAADPDRLAFCAALAQQCFINEYAFATTAPELADVERLKMHLADYLARGLPIDPLRVVALAMYLALNEVADADALASRDWPAPVADVIRQQVREPRAEKKLRELIPRLTPIGNGVTANVREQYEENPYPRWVRLPDAPAPILIDDHIRRHFPTAPVRPLGAPDTLDILVAGCGTGRYALELAQTYRGARVLGVDLSLSSLASARRRTPQRLAGKIEFAQADIFALSSIGRAFDVINAGGVLHHMADPLAGWRELIKLMKPNGLMQVGLYSAYARRDIVAARAAIVARGYRSTPADIRRCRQDLLSGAEQAKYMQLNDFFTISECRDLLFHVHERQLTIPEIKDFLAQNGLTFIGFEFSPPEAHVHYRNLFARNGWSFGDLDRWDAYERRSARRVRRHVYFLDSEKLKSASCSRRRANGRFMRRHRRLRMRREPIARGALGLADFTVAHLLGDFTAQPRCVRVPAQGGDVEPLMRRHHVYGDAASGRINHATVEARACVRRFRDVCRRQFLNASHFGSPFLCASIATCAPVARRTFAIRQARSSR